jgi:hypothetical protein
MDPLSGLLFDEVAKPYAQSIESSVTGQIIDARKTA